MRAALKIWGEGMRLRVGSVAILCITIPKNKIK